tara:strand:- start:34341 stop:34793 length:453 start_codon:yes stop_codon:yes gene_type:complete
MPVTGSGYADAGIASWGCISHFGKVRPAMRVFLRVCHHRIFVMIAWVYLFIAIGLEVVGTVSLKFSNGFTDWRFSVLTLGVYGLSFWVLSLTLRVIPIGTAYAVWAGLGTAAIAVIGLVFFKEPMTVMKGVFLLMIIGGVVGLKAISSES